jgi:hypothetical protein
LDEPFRVALDREAIVAAEVNAASGPIGRSASIEIRGAVKGTPKKGLEISPWSAFIY